MNMHEHERPCSVFYPDFWSAPFQKATYRKCRWSHWAMRPTVTGVALRQSATLLCVGMSCYPDNGGNSVKKCENDAFGIRRRGMGRVVGRFPSISEGGRGIKLIPRPSVTPCNISLLEERMGFGGHQNVIKIPCRKRLSQIGSAIIRRSGLCLHLPWEGFLQSFAAP